MTKVYMIREFGGSYEDSWDRFHSAYFNKEKAESEVARLELEWEIKQSTFTELNDHYYNCNFKGEWDEEKELYTSCPICDERKSLVNDVEDGKGYRIVEIDVE